MEEIKMNLGRVMAIGVLRDKIAELTRTIRDMGEPVLTDLNLLPELYDAYVDVFRKRGCGHKASEVYNRKKFLFVILYLYSPSALAGAKMRVGMRHRLSQLFGIQSQSAISDNCSNLMFQYRQYRDFKRDVALIYKSIAERVGDRMVLSE